MYFGWSAGDVASTISFLVKVARAMDSAQGAAKDYRDSVAFLQNLTSTLQMLEVLAQFNLRSAHSPQIQKQVDRIKEPIEQFLAMVRKLAPDLGEKAKAGHRRHIPQKLQWHFKYANRVADLKAKIGDDMQVLSVLQQSVI